MIIWHNPFWNHNSMGAFSSTANGRTIDNMAHSVYCLCPLFWKFTCLHIDRALPTKVRISLSAPPFCSGMYGITVLILMPHLLRTFFTLQLTNSVLSHIKLFMMWPAIFASARNVSRHFATPDLFQKEHSTKCWNHLWKVQSNVIRRLTHFP